MATDAREALIDRFERTFDLPAYLVHRGYRLAQDQSDQLAISMVHPGKGDAVVLRKDLERGSWTFESVQTPSDKGGISEFLHSREGSTREACLERLIACADVGRRDAEAVAYRSISRDKPPDLATAELRHVIAVTAARNAVRVLERLGVSRHEYDSWRFGPVRSDADVARVISEPQALAASRFRPSDKRLVFTERPVDAIAYERAKGKELACYMYTGGQLEPDTLRKIAHLVAEVPAGMTVVLAFGRDERGETMAEQIRQLAPSMRMERDRPELGARWADQMQLEQRHARSLQRSSPAMDR